ncbi:TraB/GumN family protein [Candidatus Woesearchaeota archaeon]|nr:TraB/GumN family protein [Candidatus Woesearchaeota archaeon]
MVNNLTIIGTSHIATESIAEVKRVITELKPAVVAVELDSARAHALFQRGKQRGIRWQDIKRIGIKGYLFSLIGAYVEKKLGERVGTTPGAEMKAAILAAREVGAQVALIDQDITITLQRFSQTLTWKEKFQLVWDLMTGFFGREKIPFDLSKVPQKELITKLTREFKRKYPNMYQVLVVERNIHMARHLAHLLQHTTAPVLAIVGAGHEQEIERLVQKYIKIEDRC